MLRAALIIRRGDGNSQNRKEFGQRARSLNFDRGVPESCPIVLSSEFGFPVCVMAVIESGLITIMTGLLFSIPRANDKGSTKTCADTSLADEEAPLERTPLSSRYGFGVKARRSSRCVITVCILYHPGLPKRAKRW
jgi:hypothetical protein